MTKKNWFDLSRLSVFVCSASLALLFCQQNGRAQTYDLIHEIEADSTLEVTTQLQYTGSVIVDGAGEDEDSRALPLDVRARLHFDQRISSGSTNSPQAIRYFDKALATIQAGQGETTSRLSKQNNLVLARMNQEADGNHQFQIASIGDCLSQQEYELLKNPGDPLAFTSVFDKRGVAIGEKWQLQSEQLADLLSVNRIINSSVSMMLKTVEEGIAKIYLFGEVKAEVDDAITEMNVKGIALLDMKAKLVTSLRMTIAEERRTGQVAPGFEGKVKLDTKLAATTPNIMLNKQSLAARHKGQKVKFAFLLDDTESDFTLVHDTRWRVIASEEDAAVLRLMDDGQLIAQCNIVQLPRRPEDQPLTLSQFQQEVQKITGDSQARIVSTDRFNNESGLETLHVVVDGVESGIPFSWLYYHIAATDGRRVTMVFTLEKEAADYFADADRQLVNNLTFRTPREASGKPLLPSPHAVR